MNVRAATAPMPSLTEFHRRAPTTVRELTDAYHAPPDMAARKASYDTLTSQFYDLVTDFYEYGWGPSFHFAPQFRGESFAASIARQEHLIALRLGLRPGMRVLDAGCGVGGPMRAIARFSGASIVGISNSAYHVERAAEHNRQAGLDHQCALVHGDFLRIPEADGSFDAAYQIEATCHAPELVAVYREIHRVLRPGARFAGYEWCITPRFDPSDAEHRAIKRQIEVGNSVPELRTFDEALTALAAAGFEVECGEDLALAADPETPWHLPLRGGRWYTASGFRASPFGRLVTHALVRGLETAGVLEDGASEISTLLRRTADALVRGGELGIFTPMYFTSARKPEAER
jgi:sterol 24-C-methyltransferase